MSSVSGIRDGEFDRITLTYDLAVGEDADFGTAGQVLMSGGENEPLTWGSNSASLPASLFAGTDISITRRSDGTNLGEFTGLVEANINWTGSDTTLNLIEGNGISIVSSGLDRTISARVDSDAQPTLRNNHNSDELQVLRVPNNLTANLGLEYSSGTSYDGSVQRTLYTKVDSTTIDNQGGTGFDELNVKKVPYSITFATDGSGSRTGTFDGSGAITIDNRDSDTTYTATAPIDITSEVISLNKDATLTTITNNLSVVKVPNTLTITDSAGTSVVYDGSATKSITINDNDTTYQGGTGISIDTTTDPDTINCSNIPNSALANSTISGISLGSNLANLTAGTNISFDVGTTYNGSTAITISATDTDTGITDLNEGDGINITDVSATEKTISVNIDTNTLEFKTDTLGAPEPKEVAVKKVPHTLTITDSAGTSVVFDGSATKSITINDNNTEYTATQPIRISASDVISIGLDDYPDGTETLKVNASNEVEVVRVPNKLTAGTNITFDTGTTYDGSGAITISATDTDTTYTATQPIRISASDVISIGLDDYPDGTETLKVNASNEVEVVRVPNKLTAGTGITFSTGTTYDGSGAITISSSDSTTTETIVVQVNPTSNTTYAVYRKQLTDARSLTEQFYPIDTNFHYDFTSNPVARYYKVDIQFIMTNGATALPVLTSEPVFLRIDKDSNGDNAWGIPQVIDYAFQNGTTIHIKQASFIVDFGSSYASSTPKIHPSMIQQSASAVSPSEGRRATNENSIVLYGGTASPQGLMMVLTPLGNDITTTTSGNPYTIPAEDY